MILNPFIIISGSGRRAADPLEVGGTRSGEPVQAPNQDPVGPTWSRSQSGKDDQLPGGRLRERSKCHLVHSRLQGREWF
jgi:hypothetical protein